MKGYAYQVQEETDIETDMQGYAGQLLAQAIAKRQEAGENAPCLRPVISEQEASRTCI